VTRACQRRCPVGAEGMDDIRLSAVPLQYAAGEQAEKKRVRKGRALYRPIKSALIRRNER